MNIIQFITIRWDLIRVISSIVIDSSTLVFVLDGLLELIGTLDILLGEFVNLLFALDELDEPDDFDELDELDELDALDESDEPDELDELGALSALDELDELDELGALDLLDALDALDLLGVLDLLDALDALGALGTLDELLTMFSGLDVLFSGLFCGCVGISLGMDFCGGLRFPF